MGASRLAPVFIACLLAPATPVFSQQPAAPLAHVAFVEGTASLERDGSADALTGGMPLVDGDRLRTSDARIEVRFGSGSILYIDQFSTLDVLSEELLRLLAGAITFEVAGSRPYLIPLYRIDTPAASITIDAPGDYRVTALTGAAAAGTPSGPPRTTVQVVRGTANLTSENGGTTLRTGEQSTVTAGNPPEFPVRFNSARWDPFRQWVELRRGERAAMSVSGQYLPREIQPYAGALDRYGTWARDAQFGVVWYPTIGGGWQPYHSGRWAWIAPFGWTWVGTEAWAWPTLHYGQWCQNASGSWFWIPGNSWGTAAPILARSHRAEFLHPAPGSFAPGARLRERSLRNGDGLSQWPSAVRDARPALQHDPLAQRPLSPMPHSSLGLPFPATALPPLRQGIAPTVPSVGAAPQMRLGTGWAGRSVYQQQVSPGPMTSQPQAPAAPPPTLGWGGPQWTAPRAMPPAAPVTGGRPQLGVWGSIAPAAPLPR